MVAFNFKARFVAPLIAGTKPQTIRTNRRRNSKVGDTLQLYTGSRFKPRLVGKAKCLDCGDITLFFGGKGTVVIQWRNAGGQVYDDAEQLDYFARNDGFENWLDLCLFWQEEHGQLEPNRFQGWITYWGASLVPSGEVSL